MAYGVMPIKDPLYQGSCHRATATGMQRTNPVSILSLPPGNVRQLDGSRDSGSFQAGGRVGLEFLPSRGGVKLEHRSIDLGGRISLQLISRSGSDEGLLFVGGGGNFGSSAKGLGYTEARISLAGKLADAAATIGDGCSEGFSERGVITDAVLRGATDRACTIWNNMDDCTGVAFAHGVAFR